MSAKCWKKSMLLKNLHRVLSVFTCKCARILRCFSFFVCRLSSKLKSLQMVERELEQQRKQHNVAMDKLLLQTQSLEQALKTERQIVTEEKWV